LRRFRLDVEPQLIPESHANTRCVIFHIHFVPAFIPGFDFSYGLLPSCRRRLSAPPDYLRSFDRPPPPACPLLRSSHGACTRNSKPRAIATPCLPEPRHHAIKLRHGSIAPATAVPSNPHRFATAQSSRKPGSPGCGLQGLPSGVPEPPARERRPSCCSPPGWPRLHFAFPELIWQHCLQLGPQRLFQSSDD
jgi:hypothetical protein